MIYDVAIVGSGPSAAACHFSLMRSDRNISVCILEGGGERAEYGGSFASKPSANFKLSPSTYLGHGGTSELWHCVLAPLDEVDFKARPALGCPEWPISLGDLNPHYEDTLKFLGVANERIFENEKSQFSLDHLELEGFDDVFDAKLFIQLKRRWKAASYWSANLPEIKHEHYVRCLELNGNLVKVVSSNFENNLNAPVLARKVIVCAGGLNSPQIVYNSDFSEAARQNIGKTLLDHPMAVGMQIERPRKYNFDILTSRKEREVNKKIAFRVKESIQLEEGLPNSSFFFRPAFKRGHSQTTERLKTQLIAYRDYVKKKKIPLKLTMELVKNWDVVGQVISYKSGFLTTSSLFDIFCVTEQVDRSSNLSFEMAEDGFYRGVCNWQVGDLDRRLNQKILQKVVDWTQNSSPNGKTTVLPQNVNWQDFATSAAHHIGTLPMANDEKTGVTDKYGNVFGTENRIYVADASIMPSAGCANVTLTSMALAMRIGEHVAERL
jgi:hypothetical protein